MNKNFILWLAITAITIAVLSGTTYGIIKMTRGIRNNNPGNIRHGTSQWKGMSISQPDPEFVTFESPIYGIRAMTRLLKNYQTRHGLNTIRQLITRWAPPSENLTDSYVNHVAQVTGISPDASINVNDYMMPIVTTIIKHENSGINPYDPETLRQGIALA